MNHSDRSDVYKKIFVLTISLFVYGVCIAWLNPLFVKALHPLTENINPVFRPIFRHFFMFTTLTAILCASTWIYLNKRWGVQVPKFRLDSDEFLFALKVTIPVCTATFVFGRFLGASYTASFNLPVMIGNIVSNTNEEIIFRGLLLFTFLYVFKSNTIAIVLSAVFFGLSHLQYPLIAQLYIVLIGIVFSAVVIRRDNLATAILIHCLSDWVCDSFMKM